MTSHKFETTIASDTAAGQAVQEQIIALLEERDYSSRDVFGMRLSLEEAIVNAIKVVPYFALGQFTSGNLLTSAILIPLAPLATLAGAWMVKRISQDLFYQISYAALIPLGLKLIWDGFVG